ncbi:hypothetical protein RchiOBHm_Chr7g0229801 [Rosa chinensis]|uniref:Uncharacterized protein n=1 Tax=Rosa chinensis TaxID=74649 RepID=A0A2P6PFA6_ROSCH|nr:hypothetical protein RchiOBHm_Chr7g0229801 [Rosa chinensis]
MFLRELDVSDSQYIVTSTGVVIELCSVVGMKMNTLIRDPNLLELGDAEISINYNICSYFGFQLLKHDKVEVAFTCSLSWKFMVLIF